MAHTFTVTITDEEYRAFSLRVLSPEDWVENAVLNKVRKNMIWIAEEASKPDAFDPTDKQAIEALMVQEGDIMKPPKQYSDTVKREMAKRIKMKTRTERDTEEMTGMRER